jgi:CBS-domain-containing membrane protein
VLGRLESLTVGDVMSRDVAVIPCSATMHQAAFVLDARHASGAPVVDKEGRCVGILSAADFVTFEICRTGDEPSSDERWRDSLSRGEYLAWNSVRRFMATAVQTVTSNTTLLEASQMLCAEHIHRLVVLSEHFVPVGIVSTLDIVAALTKASNEVGRRPSPHS